MNITTNFGAPMRNSVRLAGMILCAATLAFTAIACGGNTEAAKDNASSQETHREASRGQAITAVDPWIKAAGAGDTHAMTAAFMTLKNSTDDPVELVSATVEGAELIELHETVADDHGATIMRKVDGGFEIPAQGERILVPGGEHIMLMELSADFVAGDVVDIMLGFASGEELVVPATVREFSGAQEEYAHEETAKQGEHGHEDHDSDH
jgi:copper(I)-binding protein